MKLGRNAALAAIAVALCAGPGAMAADPVPPPTVVAPLPAGATPAAVKLARVVSQMSRGERFGNIRIGLLCEEDRPLVWESDPGDEKLDTYLPIFARELSSGGFRVEGDPSDLFAEASSDVSVGVVLRNVRASACERAQLFGSGASILGRLTFDADWQVYSRLRQQVIARVSTHGGVDISKGVLGGPAILFNQAFGEHVRQLAMAEAFRTAVTTPLSLSAGQGPAQPLAFRAAPPGRRAISVSAESVVAVFAGDGHGTGFLIANDGYVLTNHHVVGGAKHVKIRWHDRTESLGEVLRSDRSRDVALVKVDAAGRKSMPLRRAAATAGEPVFAIGTPLDAKFQGTITKGIVSSSRTYDGQTFIQSDVNINPGNSGGPLLDEAGAVIGLAVSGYRIGDAPTGLNLFIPIGDALDALALKPAS